MSKSSAKGGEMNQALYAHMNNKRKKKKRDTPALRVSELIFDSKIKK
jgi:hypothetical protein